MEEEKDDRQYGSRSDSLATAGWQADRIALGRVDEVRLQFSRDGRICIDRWLGFAL